MLARIVHDQERIRRRSDLAIRNRGIDAPHARQVRDRAAGFEQLLIVDVDAAVGLGVDALHEVGDRFRVLELTHGGIAGIDGGPGRQLSVVVRAIEAVQRDLVVADRDGEIGDIGIPDRAEAAARDGLVEDRARFRLALQFQQRVDLGTQGSVALDGRRAKAFGGPELGERFFLAAERLQGIGPADRRIVARRAASEARAARAAGSFAARAASASDSRTFRA